MRRHINGTQGVVAGSTSTWRTHINRVRVRVNFNVTHSVDAGSVTRRRARVCAHAAFAHSVVAYTGARMHDRTIRRVRVQFTVSHSVTGTAHA